MLEPVMRIERGYKMCRLQGQRFQRQTHIGPMSNITPISPHTRMRDHMRGDVGGHASSLIIQISKISAKGR